VSDLDPASARRAEAVLLAQREAYADYLALLGSAQAALARLDLDTLARDVEAAGLRLGDLAEDGGEVAALRVALRNGGRQGPLSDRVRAALRDLEALTMHAARLADHVMAGLREAQAATAAAFAAAAEATPYESEPLPALLYDRTG